MNWPTNRSAGLVMFRAIAIWALAASPSFAGFLTLSPIGAGGPGGSITFAEIGQTDPTSANVNTDFTASGSIAITFTVSDKTPISLYGTAVNDSSLAWLGFSAKVISGAASFQSPNDLLNAYGTYTDTTGWTVALSNGGLEADFSGPLINGATPPLPGSSLDLFLGLVVSDPTQSVTIALTPLSPATVPEPSSLLLGAIAAATLGLVRHRRSLPIAAILAVAVGIGSGSNARAAGPVVAPAYQTNFTIAPAGTVSGVPTQMVFGPDGRLYVMTINAGPISYLYNKSTGALSAPIMVAPNVKGIGLGFHGTDLYLTTQVGTIHKLKDSNGNGVYGESGELDVAIVTGLPQGDHNTDQIQITGDTLYVGIGRRTINGRFGAWTSGSISDVPTNSGFFFGGQGPTYGDSAYNGTISWIQNLNAVVDQTGSANAFNTEPPALTQALIQHDNGPFTSVGQGKLLVHSAGTRNPFGLCLDKNGGLWFTNNYNRAQTLGNGQTPFGLRGDQPNSDLSIDIHDQLFHASPGADYGYADSNWRNVNPMMTPSAPGYHLVRSTTFDNSYNKGPYTIHDPTNPDGCGPSASADGCAFAYHTSLPADLVGNLFVVRYNGAIKEAPGGAQRTITYNDLIAVNPASGKVRRVASGFNGPLSVLSDDTNGRLLIGNANDGVIYSLQSTGQ